jgi:TIR domain-containing protein
MHKVFISYSSKDTAFAAQLERLLHKANISGFLDQSDIAAGAVISSLIREEINSASAVLVLLSENAVKSNWVLFEIGLAQSLGKPIIPILLPTSDLDKSVLDLVNGYRVIDARNRSIPEIAEEIDSALELQPA